MCAQHKTVSTTSDKAEYRTVEGRIIGTVFYFSYGNLFWVFVKTVHSEIVYIDWYPVRKKTSYILESSEEYNERGSARCSRKPFLLNDKGYR